jgi:fibronectin type 3 domain-containing protein
MPIPLRARRPLVRLLLFLTALWMPGSALRAEETLTLAIYQFRPENIAAMGFESDVMLAIRNEMSNRSRIDLLAKRDMEDILSRREIAQEFSVAAAVEGGRLLSVRYVLVGTVIKQGGQINASIKLVDVNLAREVETWDTAYRTRNEIDKAASRLVAEIVAAMDNASSAELASPLLEIVDSAVIALNSLSAEAKRSLIELRWSREGAVDVLGYNIYRSETPNGPFSFLDTTDGNSYQDSSAEAGITYYYQVGEVDIEGTEARGTRTAEATIQAAGGTAGISPPVIYGLKPLAGGVQLEFFRSMVDGSDPVSRFRIYRADGDRDWQVIGQVPVAAKKPGQTSAKENLRHPYTDTKLRDGERIYRYAVSAVAADGSESALSDSFEYAPARLGELEVAGQELLRSGSLRWRAANIGLGYRIYRRSGEQAWQRVGEIQGLMTTVFTDTNGLRDGQEYEYSYTVYDEQSESPRSFPVVVRTKPPLPAPAELTASSGLATQVALNWDAVNDPDVKAYAIYRADFSEDMNVEMTRIAMVESSAGLAHTDRGASHALRDGARYLYAVATVNKADGEGPLSPPVEARTKPLPPPVDTASGSVEADRILISWETGHEDIAEFVLSRRWEGGDWEELASVPAAERSYADTVLRPYARAEYQVTVVDSTGLRSAAATVNAQQSPVKVLLVAAPEARLRASELNWNKQALVEAFEISRQQLPDGDWRLLTTLRQPDATSYLDEAGLLDGVAYAYKVAPLVQDQRLGESNSVTSTTKVVSAPDQVQASSGNAREITLRWPPASDSDVAGYVIYRGKGVLEAGQLEPYTEVAGGKASEFVDQGSKEKPLEHGVQYSYAVAAKNVMGGIGPPGAVSIGSSKPLPEPVFNLVAYAEGAAIKLSWEYENRDNVAEFQVFAREPDSPWVLLETLDSGQNGYLAQQLKPFVSLQYRLLVEDVDGLVSEETLSPEVKSPAQVNLQVAAEPRLRQVELSWNQQFNVSGFIVQRRPAGDPQWAEIKTLRGGDDTSYVDKKGLTDGADYEYRLVALDDRRPLGESNSATGRTKDLPQAPLEFQAESGLVGKVRLHWTAIDDTDVGGYTLYRVDNGALTRLASVSGADKDVYLDEGGMFDSLDNGSDYSYAIAAYNSYRVEGQKSELITATTKPLPTPVTGVQAQQDEGVVSLSWNPNPEQDIEHYIVARSSRSGCSNFSDLAKISGAKSSFRDEQARPDSRYCYRVTAVDVDSLEGGHSNVVEVSIPAIVSAQ